MGNWYTARSVLKVFDQKEQMHFSLFEYLADKQRGATKRGPYSHSRHE